jgi:hypothetical protein
MPNTLRSRQQQRASSRASQPAPKPDHLEFVSDRVYDPPLLGIQRSTGLPVSILERGNTPGMSATWLTNSPTGIPQILTLADVRMTGSTCGLIPPQASQLEAVFEDVKFED